MNLELIHVGNALDFPGMPLSAACLHGDVVRTAGIVPLDPDTGDVVEGDVGVQARRVLDNLERILHAAGSSLDRVLVVRIYLADIRADLDGFNRVYGEYFADHHPARYALGATLALPSFKVELQVEAAR